MARLTADEARLLKRLQRKSEEPDAPPVSKSLSISVDLGDEKQVERATKLGLLDLLTGADEDDDESADEDDDESTDEDDDVPRRRGYFKD